MLCGFAEGAWLSMLCMTDTLVCELPGIHYIYVYSGFAEGAWPSMVCMTDTLVCEPLGIQQNISTRFSSDDSLKVTDCSNYMFLTRLPV